VSWPTIRPCRLQGRRGIRAAPCASSWTAACRSARGWRRNGYGAWLPPMGAGVGVRGGEPSAARPGGGDADRPRCGRGPAYFDLLSFLPPADYGDLLDAAGFSSAESPVVVTGKADPLLFEWRRVHQPITCDEGQRPSLAACLEASSMRNVSSGFIGRPAQARRLSLMLFRSDIARYRNEHPEGGSDHDAALDGFVHLWQGYLAHGRRQLAGAGCGWVIVAPQVRRRLRCGGSRCRAVADRGQDRVRSGGEHGLLSPRCGPAHRRSPGPSTGTTGLGCAAWSAGPAVARKLPSSHNGRQ